jgi:hypothetical protein
MSRERQTGLMWTGGPGPCRCPRIETCPQQGMGLGSLPGQRSLRAQLVAQAMISEGRGRKRSRQVLRGSAHATMDDRRPGRHGGSTEVKGSAGAWQPRCGPEASRAMEMSIVTRTFTGERGQPCRREKGSSSHGVQ